MIRVIGVGNEMAGDDVVGLLIVRALRERNPEVDAVEAAGDGTKLIEFLDGIEAAVIVDAMRSGAAPGVIRRFDARMTPLPARSFRDSTHAVNVAEGIELARALGALPPRLVVYGIEGKCFDAACGVAREVTDAIMPAVGQIIEEIERLEGVARHA